VRQERGEPGTLEDLDLELHLFLADGKVADPARETGSVPSPDAVRVSIGD